MSRKKGKQRRDRPSPEARQAGPDRAPAASAAARGAPGPDMPTSQLLQEAVAHHQAGRLKEAKTLYRRILEVRPDHPEALNYCGVASFQLGDMKRAIELLRKAVAIDPRNADAHYNLGLVFQGAGRLNEAAAAYRRAIARNSGHTEALNNLGNLLKDQGRLMDAEEFYRQALAHNPGQAESHNNLGNVLRELGRVEEAEEAFRRALALKPDYPEAHSNLLFNLNYVHGDRTSVHREHLEWAARHAQPFEGALSGHDNPPDPERRLKVGYVSPDFRRHSVSYFFEPLIAAHDRGQVEVFCYAWVHRPDAVTERLQKLADHWISTVGMPESEMARRVREDGIDILVDLAGHTGKNQLRVFAQQPAPVQATWLGYPNTTGLAAVGYRLTDGVADPEGADAFYTEKLVRLDGGFLCFRPDDDAPRIAPPPSAARGHVTFGSFNNLAKAAPETLAAWAGILRRVPGSRLLLKSKPLSEEAPRRRVSRLFRELGIEEERVELCGWLAATADHLGAYERIDIGLDPFPYNGTTTTCEALWMGVPVVTLMGDRHAGRVGASLLSHAGLAELVAGDEEEYVTKAVELASDAASLATLRDGLRERLRASPLCDAMGFARRIEAAYRTMWREWCAGPEGK